MQFRATVQLNGKTATGVRVPEKLVSALGSSRRPPVRVTINGYTYRSSVASMGGKFLLGISSEIRNSAGIAAGDEIDIDIELDTEPRQVSIPHDFHTALAASAKAARVFESLSYSNKLRLVLSIEGAKAVETRQRRIAKAVTMLREGRV